MTIFHRYLFLAYALSVTNIGALASPSCYEVLAQSLPSGRIALIQPVTSEASHTLSVSRSPTGESIIDWSEATDKVTRYAKVNGIKDIKAEVLIDGKVIRTFKSNGETRLKILLDPDDQYKVEVRFTDGTGKTIHLTETRLLELKVPPSVDPSSYKNFPDVQINEPESVSKALGIDDGLTPAVYQISRKKVAYIFKNQNDPRIKNLSSDLDVVVSFDKNDKPVKVHVYDRKKNQNIELDPSQVILKADAAFNKNSFFWDDMSTCMGVMWDDPKRCRDTIDFWLKVQEPNGAIPREVLKKNVRVSYNPPEKIQLGQVTPNGSYTNPNLMGWATENLVDLTGKSPESTELMRKVVKALEKNAQWMDENRCIVDEYGKQVRDPKTGRPLGYFISNLGDGMDNSPRKEGPGVGFVSEFARRIELAKSMSRIYARLGDWKKSEAKLKEAQEFENILNSRYWSPKKSFYFDLVPDSSGKLATDEANPTAGGFWPMWSGSSSKEQVKEMIQGWWTPYTFGGDLPIPSLPRNHPEFHKEGHYWQGGYWAILTSMVSRAWEKSGVPQLSFDSTAKMLKGMSEVSRDFENENGRKTVFEFYGETETTKGKELIRGIQTNHTTRADFTGWSLLTPTNDKLRYVDGFRPIPGFSGNPTEKGIKHWAEDLAEGKSFENTNYLRFNPFRNSPQQLKMIGEGYIELNLRYNMGSEPFVLKNLSIGGKRIDEIRVEKFQGGTSPDDRFRVLITSREPAAFNLTINRLYDSNAPIGKIESEPLRVSRIQKIRAKDGKQSEYQFELIPSDSNKSK